MTVLKAIAEILYAKKAEDFGLIYFERGVNMNVRKNIDYSWMYAAIDAVMAPILPQMQLYNGQYRLWTWMKLLIRTEFHRSYVRKKKEITSDSY